MYYNPQSQLSAYFREDYESQFISPSLIELQNQKQSSSDNEPEALKGKIPIVIDENLNWKNLSHLILSGQNFKDKNIFTRRMSRLNFKNIDNKISQLKLRQQRRSSLEHNFRLPKNYQQSQFARNQQLNIPQQRKQLNRNQYRTSIKYVKQIRPPVQSLFNHFMNKSCYCNCCGKESSKCSFWINDSFQQNLQIRQCPVNENRRDFQFVKRYIKQHLKLQEPPTQDQGVSQTASRNSRGNLQLNELQLERKDQKRRQTTGKIKISSFQLLLMQLVKRSDIQLEGSRVLSIQKSVDKEKSKYFWSNEQENKTQNLKTETSERKLQRTTSFQYSQNRYQLQRKTPYKQIDLKKPNMVQLLFKENKSLDNMGMDQNNSRLRQQNSDPRPYKLELSPISSLLSQVRKAVKKNQPLTKIKTFNKPLKSYFKMVSCQNEKVLQSPKSTMQLIADVYSPRHKGLINKQQRILRQQGDKFQV